MIRAFSLASILAAALALPAMAQEAKAPLLSGPASQAWNGDMLTAQEAQDWIGKPVFSSDWINIGEVESFQREDGNKVTGMRVNIAAFLGMGEHRISLMPAQFKLQIDSVILDVTAAQAKALQSVEK